MPGATPGPAARRHPADRRLKRLSGAEAEHFRRTVLEWKPDGGGEGWEGGEGGTSGEREGGNWGRESKVIWMLKTKSITKESKREKVGRGREQGDIGKR